MHYTDGFLWENCSKLVSVQRRRDQKMGPLRWGVGGEAGKGEKFRITQKETLGGADHADRTLSPFSGEM